MGMGYTAETAAIWSERVRGWRASGLTATAYADGKGFAGSTLRFWANRLKSAPVTSAPRVVQLVARRAEPEAEVVIEIGAARVRVRRGFDRALLAEVLGALGEVAR
jgi:hypothetical protein